MRRFLAGVATGLVVSGFLRQLQSNKRNQDRLDLYYERRAGSYNATDQWVGIGDFKPRIQLRLQLFDQMDLRPGDRVLDVGCGAGANFEYILERIGPQGWLVGTDYSQPMLDEAQELVEKHAWQNVRLVQSDAAALSLNDRFDKVLSTLALVVIPDYVGTMERMWEHLKPGGMMGIADLCESQRWYMAPLNFIMDITDAALITQTKRRPWEWLEDHAENYQWDDLLFGYMYTATGIKPGEPVG